jgi:cytochrome d ubiquinol oxidase subunit I
VSGIPIVITGFTGSLMVIAVNAWMNHPTGFRLRGGKVTRRRPVQGAVRATAILWHELIHMYVAGYMVTGFIFAGCYAFGGCADAGVATSAWRWRSR